MADAVGAKGMKFDASPKQDPQNMSPQELKDHIAKETKAEGEAKKELKKKITQEVRE